MGTPRGGGSGSGCWGHVSIGGGGGDFCFPACLRRGEEAYILARVVPTSPVKARGVVQHQQQQLLWTESRRSGLCWTLGPAARQLVAAGQPEPSDRRCFCLVEVSFMVMIEIKQSRGLLSLPDKSPQLFSLTDETKFNQFEKLTL